MELESVDHSVFLPHRTKLKGQCTDVKSGCGPSVGPSLHPPQSQLKQKFCATVPLTSAILRELVFPTWYCRRYSKKQVKNTWHANNCRLSFGYLVMTFLQGLFLYCNIDFTQTKKELN